MSIIEKIMQAVEGTVVEAEVDFPAGREAGPRIEYDSDELRQKIEAILSLTTKETFSGTDDADTPLKAAAREAGWALMEVVDEIAWEKREQVSDIIGQLGAALTAADTSPERVNETPKSEQVIPDGWQLVPGEPTDAMILAYNVAGVPGGASGLRWNEGPPRNLSVDGYRAMLAAAPEDGR